MNLKKFKEHLNKIKKEGKISYWTIKIRHNKKNNIYLQKDYKIESILDSERKEVQFTVYKEFDERVGQSSFVFPFSDDFETFKDELKDAIFICSKSKSKKYSLPKKRDTILCDNNINYKNFYNQKFVDKFNNKELESFVKEKIELFKRLIKEEDAKQKKITLNCFEFFNTLEKIQFVNSEDIKKEYTKTKSYIQFVLILHKEKKETEHIIYKRINDSFSFDFEKFFNNEILNVLETGDTIPAKNFNGKVILLEKATSEFFNPDLTMNPLIGHASARLKFLGISQYEKNKKILEAKNDKLTISLNPLLKKNFISKPFDNLGITGKKISLINNNTFQNYFATKQYADYLNIKPTGPFGVIEIKEGKKMIRELSKDDYVEIISFSSFVPDIVSGDFSAEIRFGYLVQNNRKIQFKGGLFTGNVFNLLKEAELSKEKIEEAGYFGPKAIKFNRAEIVGL